MPSATADPEADHPREIAGAIPQSFLMYVRRARGSESAARVASSIGLSVAELRATTWFTTDEALTVAKAAAEECGDDDIGRRAAEAIWITLYETGMVDFLVSTGSPLAAITTMCEYGTRTSTNRDHTVVDSGDDFAIVESRYMDLSVEDRIFCSFAAAVYSLVPSPFGFAGTTAEVECQLRGDPVCRFEIRWQPDPRALAPDVLASAARHNGMLITYDQMRTMAGDLAGARDVPEALDHIVTQANLALAAPRYLLSVSIDDDDSPQLRHLGFPEDCDIAAIAPQVLTDTYPDHAVLLVDVVSGRHAYGRLAAIYPAGRTFGDAERRIFEGYAAHAAGALDAIVALDTARRNRDTSVALLELARILAEVTTSDQMVERLAGAIIPVVACTSSSVWLGERDSFALAAVAGAGVQPAGAKPLLSPTDVRAVAAASMAGRPVIVDAHAAPAAVLASLGDIELTRVALAPIVVRQELLGVAVAGFVASDGVTRDRDLLERLAALTDHAATALDNARLLERVNHNALHDTLTGLPNRTLIEDRVDAVLRRAGRTDTWPSLLFIDLDRFKNVNDTLGHGAGDDLIRQVGARLNSVMRESDTLGRLGGDEFVVLLDGPESVANAELVAERIGTALRAPFVVAERELFISCSIGIASAPRDGTTYERLLQHADVAMYDAKDGGRGTFAVYAPPLSGPRRASLDLESRLHRAVENGELVVLFQPQVDLRTSAVIGTEALVRWDHPELGRLAPDRFLPLAEASGVIVEIDRWVRAEAFAQTRRWIDAGLDLRIAVNLSTRDLHKRGLADEIAAEVVAAGIPAGSVEVEVTDRVVMADDTLPAVVQRLRDVGLRVAIDDFGTGSSVLGRLRSCSLNTLKIDRSFVSEIGT
ncbi:MAG: hypothetical protein QOI47_950, partial [Actinomycetota bacterium]|nr:hypothetical protein [Actinomycetota bacterium]